MIVHKPQWTETVIKTGRPKFLHNVVRDWYSHTENDYFKFDFAKVVLEAVESWGAFGFSQNTKDSCENSPFLRMHLST